MSRSVMSRRMVVQPTLAAVGMRAAGPRASELAGPTGIKLPDDAPIEKFEFETKGIEGWTTVDGQWSVEDMAGAPSGRKVLVQRAVRNEFNVIVAPPRPVHRRRRLHEVQADRR